ncbi:TrpR family protein YerC/YecD [Pseudoramibacter alactolyticus ATCC 23263]|uniref:TrpR family protein YerC/YecD n=1 Tax=Pseudoramibacter alactolyticus ATCC 23263 TaxID=887929 RepID=E6MDH3_9FIRM|nr:YerC/YecD family TrpR-related protein [Pseudoramibacter alactolyticus]EFV02858.1 TrpR family protein YerC/YecD [Pseudoramibacter alactolyticus ATCC 23263]
MEVRREALVRALLSIEDAQMANDLLDDMCTIKEIEDMANRLTIAELLAAGKTFIDVEKATGASSATISRVNKCLKHGRGYRRVIDRMNEAEPGE